jgi:hypothetical protein
MVLLDKVVELWVVDHHGGGFLENKVDELFCLGQVEEERIVGDTEAVECQAAERDPGKA